MKKSRSKRRGIPQGVQRHTIWANEVDDGSSLLTNSWGKYGCLLSSAARFCHNSVRKVCTFLCLIPLDVSGDGKILDFVPLWKRIVHLMWALLYVSLTAYKLGVFVLLWAEEGLNTRTAMCGCSFLVLLMGGSEAFGSSWKTLEMKVLLNSWKSLLRSIQDEAGEHADIFRNSQACLEITVGTCAALLTGVDAAAFSLVIDDLPVSVFSTARRLGIIPETLLVPTVVWRVGFFPLELLISLPPMIVAAFNLHVVIVGQMVLQSSANNLRLVLKPTLIGCVILY